MLKVAGERMKRGNRKENMNFTSQKKEASANNCDVTDAREGVLM